MLSFAAVCSAGTCRTAATRAGLGSTIISVTDNPAEARYEIRADGELAGFLQYRQRPGLIELVHTEIDEEFEGRGLGSRLISFALDDARERGLAVLPFCPFVNDYMRRHRQYVELVPEGRRADFEL